MWKHINLIAHYIGLSTYYVIESKYKENGLLIAHYIGLSTKKEGRIKTWAKETYRPLYRAVYDIKNLPENSIRYLIAHYIGLSTTIFSVAFH